MGKYNRLPTKIQLCSMKLGKCSCIWMPLMFSKTSLVLNLICNIRMFKYTDILLFKNPCILCFGCKYGYQVGIYHFSIFFIMEIILTSLPQQQKWTFYEIYSHIHSEPKESHKRLKKYNSPFLYTNTWSYQSYAWMFVWEWKWVVCVWMYFVITNSLMYF
jgi:hypothetical protein